MLDRRTVFEIHRLYEQGQSIRKIARVLGVNRGVVARYLKDPRLGRRPPKRSSKLDPFKEEIKRCLEIDPKVSAAVIRQRMVPLGYDGGLSILREYLASLRESLKPRQAVIRFESLPGAQCQIDWGHFGSLTYGRTSRKLYCLAVMEAHSRLLFLQFTHSQKQAGLHDALIKAWRFFGGTPREVVVDNMLTAVTERTGPVVRFNEAFLEFLRPFRIVPRACHPGRPQEKGKIENAIKYIRRNFWPLRSFADLADLQAQADDWRDRIANQRVHATTLQRPCERFEPEAMQPLPPFCPEAREVVPAKVHADFSVRFDANAYTVPPWAIGKTVVIKADGQQVAIYDNERAIATHKRCWERRKRIEVTAHVQAARMQKRKEWLSREVDLIIALGPTARDYLENLAQTGRPLKTNVAKLIALMDEYGRKALLDAIGIATDHQAFGADYIENILYQQMTPQRHHPPVRLLKEELNRIRLEEPSLAEYDAMLLKRRPRDD